MPLGKYVINTSLISYITSRCLLLLFRTLLAVIQNCQHNYVSTKNWNTSVFSIQRGVFQGDTLSPLLFNLAINP